MTIPALRDVPGVAAQAPAETTGFVFNHTMLRVKDATASLDFYTRVLGYQLIDKRDFAEAQFSLYFLAYVPAGTVVPEDDDTRRLWMAGLPGVLELTHNHGTETQDGPSTTTATATRAALATSACRCRTSKRPASASKTWA